MHWVLSVGLSSLWVSVSAASLVLRKMKLLVATRVVVVPVTYPPRMMVSALPAVTAGLLVRNRSLGRAVLLRIPPIPFTSLSLPKLWWTADLSVLSVL